MSSLQGLNLCQPGPTPRHILLRTLGQRGNPTTASAPQDIFQMACISGCMDSKHGHRGPESRMYEASCQGHFPGSSVCNLNRTVHTEHHCLTETTTTDLRVAKGEQRGKGQAADRKPAHTRRERSRVCMSGAQPVFRKIHSMTSTPSPIQPCHQGSWQS